MSSENKPTNEGKCVYCGERDSTTMIPDPNGSIESWNVCEGCKKVIKQQMNLSLGHIIGRTELGRDFGTKMVIESEKELKRLSEEEGLDSCTCHITKKDEKNVK